MYGTLELSTDDSAESLPHKNKLSFAAIIFGVTFMFLVFLAITTRNYKSKAFFKNSIPSISVWNPDYKNSSSLMLPYPFLENSRLMEPLRPNSVVVIMDDDSYSCTGGSLSTTSDCSFSWILTNSKDPSIFETGCSQTNSFSVTPQTTGKYSLQVSVQCSDDSYSLLGDYSIWVKYVRREVRSLTDADRVEFLLAFRTLWDVSTVEGIQKYGPTYKSLFYLATIHNDGGASPLCDEFHGVSGYGFINNHVILGSYLEQSLRLVNPRVSLHYIDYFEMFTSQAYRRNHMANPLDGGAWNEILSDKYFGSNDPATGRIVDSLWESSSIPIVDDAFYSREGIDNTKPFFEAEANDWMLIGANHRKSPVGLLRSPWNFNPAAYTVRYGNVNMQKLSSVIQLNLYSGANCDLLREFIVRNVVGKPLENMLLSAEDGSHGNIHFAFGGSGGDTCIVADNQLRVDHGFTTEDLVAISICSQTFFKVPYHSDFVNSKTGTCSDKYFESENSFYQLVDEYFRHCSTSTIPSYFYDAKIPLSVRTSAMKLICNRMQFDSDMEGSGAATDPLFWVAHGNVERLLQKVMIADVLTDKIFPTSSTPVCSGHARDGVKPWLKGFYFEDPAVDAASLTNQQLLQVLDPTSTKYQDLVSYVYDNGELACSGSDLWFTKMV